MSGGRRSSRMHRDPMCSIELSGGLVEDDGGGMPEGDEREFLISAEIMASTKRNAAEQRQRTRSPSGVISSMVKEA